MKKTALDLEPESPIPFSHGSNGEYAPRPRRAFVRRAEEMFRRMVDERAGKLGVSRRQFVESAAGAATALFVINACGGSSGGGRDGGFAVDAEQTWDAGACEPLQGDEFIFDVQTHHVNPQGAWRTSSPGWELFLGSLPQGSCGQADAVDCFDTQHYLREMFVNSDTAVAVLSAVPADPGENPLEIAESTATRELVDRLAQSRRLLTHGLVLPNQAGGLDGMQALVETYDIAAWKVYTPYGGWRLDDATIGIPFIERARSLGVKTICAHKGLPLPGFDANFASPDDIGVVAAMFPDVNFVVYHSGYEPSFTEGPYDGTSPEGIDRLIKSCEDHGIGPGGNVWAELGSTWRNVMTDPTEAAHVIGKLMRYLGPERILWGTDSIWYGTPQDQITAFRALTIPQSMQETYGYPDLSAENRARIFGLNAAGLYGVDVGATRCEIGEDDIANLKRQARQEGRPPTFRAYGPRTRRELLAFLRARDGRPG